MIFIKLSLLLLSLINTSTWFFLSIYQHPYIYRPNLPSQFSPKYPSRHTHFSSKQEPPFLQEFKVHVYSKDGKTTIETSVILIFFYQIIHNQKKINLRLNAHVSTHAKQMVHSRQPSHKIKTYNLLCEKKNAFINHWLWSVNTDWSEDQVLMLFCWSIWVTCYGRNLLTHCSFCLVINCDKNIFLKIVDKNITVWEM